MTMTAFPRRSAVLLWCLAPALLSLSLYRPIQEDSHRADLVPATLGEFQRTKQHAITPSMVRLLGTRDAVWSTYGDGAGHSLYLVAVFHDANWKSLHAPHICIRGSNFTIESDAAATVHLPEDGSGEEMTVGRLLAVNRQSRRGYLVYYAFAGADFVTPSYLGFYLRHAPRALLRNSAPGFLLRVETYVGEEGLAAAEERCRTLFAAGLEAGRRLLRSP